MSNQLNSNNIQYDIDNINDILIKIRENTEKRSYIFYGYIFAYDEEILQILGYSVDSQSLDLYNPYSNDRKITITW